MFTAGQLLFPSLDLFFSRKRIGLENAIDHRCELGVRSVELNVTVEALDSQCRVVSVFLCLSGNGQLGHLGGWFISFDDFS
jgi:hypothetical protein